jgi:intracellular septation protein A
MQEYQKSQEVRIIDVLVIAPILIYAGVKYYNVMPKLLSLSLITIGAATAIYNAKNYIKNKQINNQ